jgi:tetratricopeptide (TPR) repeat protein
MSFLSLVKGSCWAMPGVNGAARAGALGVMALMLLLSLTACGDRATADDHFQKGNEFAQAGELEKAIAEYEAVLEKDPDHVSAMSNLGVVYYNLGQLEEAIEYYQKAIGAAPEDADIHSNLAAAYVQQMQLDKALQEYQEAVKLNPELAEAHFGLGVVHFQMSRGDEAIIAFERFLELDAGTDPTATDLANQYLQQLMDQ